MSYHAKGDTVQTRRLRWTATGLLIAGGIAVSCSTKLAQAIPPFLLFAVGHSIWIYAARRMADKPLLALNLGLLLLDIFAIVVRM